MRIPRFYCPQLEQDNASFTLPDEAHRHAVQVLRLRTGDSLRLFNGAGLEYKAILQEVTKRQSIVTLTEVINQNNESPLDVTLLQGVSRGERMDYALQKAVELGVNKVIPVVTERCNVQLNNGRADKRLQHWQGVMVSACEQSGRNVLPTLSNVTQFDEILTQDEIPCRLVLDPTAQQGFSSLPHHDKVAVLIGPEGGLSDAEINLARQAGFQPVRFGPRILRTETAAAAALAVLQTLWGDLA